MTDIHEIDSLKERLARIEKTVAEIKDSIGGPDDEPGEGKGDGWWGGGDQEAPSAEALTPEEIDLVTGGNKIDAIKSYHERTGLGLKEAKDAVDRLAP